MGSAQVASAYDATAGYWNPAGLVGVKDKPNLNLMHADYFAGMKGMFGASGHSTEFCLTPDQANMGYEEMTKHAAEGNCKYDSFKADGGTIDAQMSCQTARGMTTRSVLHGTFSPTGSDLKMTTDTSGAGLPGGGMHMQAEVINQRIGDCA